MITRDTLTLAIAMCFGLIAAIPTFTAAFTDDAFIHARIVENYATGGELAFNTGDTFKASSSTGYVLVLAALSKSIDTILAIRVLQAVVIVSIFILGAWLIREVNGQRALKTFFALSGVPFVLLSSYGGMETPIFVALMTGSALAFSKDRLGLALTLIALSVWFRFEAYLLLILAMTWIYSRNRSLSALVHAWPAAALIIFELIQFGTILPNAAGAKSLAYGHTLGASIKMALEFGTGELWLGALVFFILLVQAVKILRSRDLEGYENVFFAFSGGVLCAWMIGRSNLFPWYFPLVYTPFTLGLVLMPMASQTRIFKVLVILIAASFLVHGGQKVISSLDASERAPNFRVASYLRIGAALHKHCPSCSLVTSEIGGLGYGFRGVVFDGFGLADPEALRFHPMLVPDERDSASIGAIPPDYVILRDPDFVVSMPIFTQALRRTDVLEAYSRYDCLFSTDGSISLWGSLGIEVYSKEPLPAGVVELMSCGG